MIFTLVVVDMQDAFESTKNKRLIDNCIREINFAKKNDADILFVEYDGCGKTLLSLSSLTINYDHKKSIIKSHDDGSTEIISAIHKMNFDIRHLKIIGVNTDCCILETVQGLQYKLPNSKIEVISDACNSDFRHVDGLKQLKSIKKNVCVL